MRPLLVSGRNLPIEFPQEVFIFAGLRPNQRLSRKQFWRALVIHSEMLLALEQVQEEEGAWTSAAI